MPRYHLNIEFFDSAASRDDDGQDFQDLRAAMVEATASLKELAAAAVMERPAILPRGIQVTDDMGEEAGRVAVADVIPPEYR